jgi:hypothetical protein
MNFCDGSCIAYQIMNTGTPLDGPRLAKLAQDFTDLVECKN